MKTRDGALALLVLLGCRQPAVTAQNPAPAEAPPEPKVVVAAATAPLAALLSAQRRGGARQVAYRNPATDAREAYRRWLQNVLRAAQSPAKAVKQPWHLPAPPAGFLVEMVETRGLVVVRQREASRDGAGVVVFRRGEARPVAVEAPHTFFDADTLPIALSLFDALQARALLVNTVHRASAAGLDDDARSALARSGDSRADAAHAPDSYYQAAHEALSTVVSKLHTVQVHGYRDTRAPDADAVVSASGTDYPVAELVAHLRSKLPGQHIALYPRDTGKLGGTRNAQAGWERTRGGRFVHLELSRTLRTRLTRDRTAQSALAEALRATLPEATAP